MLFSIRIRQFEPLAVALTLLSCGKTGGGGSAEEAKAFMDAAEAELLKITVADNRAGWVHETYINDDTDNLAAAADDKLIGRVTELVKESARFEKTEMPADLKRKFLLLKLKFLKI